MLPSAELQEQTVVALFQKMEKEGIRYALLRNFEDFPRFGHDVDLVIHRDDLLKWRNQLKSVALEEGWDTVTECAHWAQSGSALHNIEVFRLYRKEPLAYLQVDVFHGSLLWALPLYSEEDILTGRIKHSAQPFTQCHPHVEHINHLLQIAKVSAYSGMTAELFDTEGKAERYRQKVLTYHQSDQDAFETVLKSSFSVHGLQALQALESKNLLRFNHAIQKCRQYFFFAFLMRHPLKTLRLLGNRLQHKFYSFWFRPCGFVLSIHVSAEEEKQRIQDALQSLMDANALIGFSLKWADLPRLNKQERCILERGGLIVKWVNVAKKGCQSTLTVADYGTKAALTGVLLERLIQRHQRLSG